ncbi:hypothetical protein P0E97_001830 [Vibrio metschnikovii]|uniref:DUF4180 domain-containing protein n=2 Tax=Unclassified Bacteria TaxID=49928 RepID=A0AAU6V081_UNCXX|nr:hypothetical protein [Vibrio metschnikovii]EKO3721202.1 hypothetical protein [Vibrio metschnikovii]EKO3736375.1 hypothetical protein [Vibrio metschnikovii]
MVYISSLADLVDALSLLALLDNYHQPIVIEPCGLTKLVFSNHHKIDALGFAYLLARFDFIFVVI